MSITRISKTSNGNLMMHTSSRLSTHLTFTTSQFNCVQTCGSPSYATCIAPTASPSRMCRFTDIFRLPFSHTKIIAKYFLTVKVSRSTSNRLSAPFTRLSDLVCRLAMFVAAVVVAVNRTVDSLKAIIALKCVTTSRANLHYCSYFTFESWHGYIIPHIEIEEKYCEIAARRMAQTVMALDI